MFELRPYQQQAIATTEARLAEGHRPIICAPCGSGKTVIAGAMARAAMQQGQRVLWMTGREEILRQAYRTFVAMCGPRKVGILMQKLEPWWFYPDVTVASWDTLKARWNKSDSWHIPADVVLVDEAHLSLSTVMSDLIMPHYKDRTVVGFTATPARRSGRGLGSFYTRIIQVQSVRQIIDQGFLAACEYWAGSHADTRAIKHDNRTGDFNAKELGAAHRDGVLIGDVFTNWYRLARNRHTIVFAVDIAHAQALTERFKAGGIAAEVIHSKMLRPTREMISEQFRSEEIQVLVNVGIATYGYDVPEITCVVVARPTKSIVLWHQMVGRGMRPKPDGGYCCVLDHGDNVRRLGCIEDEIRWRLDDEREAAVNTTRDGDAQREKKPEPPPTVCGNCSHVFSHSRVCPKCGWEKPVRSVDIEVVPANLVKVRHAQSDFFPEQPVPRTWYLMALGWCELSGRKRVIAKYRFKEKFKADPDPKWNKLPSFQPDPLVAAEMSAGLVNYARRRTYARQRKRKQG